MRGAYAVDAVLLGVAVVWGTSYLVAKDLTAVAAVSVVLALRYLLTAASLVVVCAGTRSLPDRRELRVGVLLGCTQAAILALETAGVAHTSATNAGLLISLTVVCTPLLESAWSRSWLPAPFFVAATLAVVGVGLLVSADGLAAPGGGDLLVLAAAGVRATHVTLIGRLTAGRAYRSLHITTVQAVVGTAVFGLAAAPQLPGTLPELSAADWGRLAYLALACSVFAFLAQTWAIRRTSASRASLLMGTEPVWAVAAGLGLGDERLTAPSAVGAALIVASTYWGRAVEGRHRARITEPETPDAAFADADYGGREPAQSAR
ncbi:DMT family transporter [Motilibacter sp. E257]|uniref:DMT family transporter n=1 Tax=Motilibacter deserti TaxID=2714956 RepID=A0ABX0H2I8_9ACTN|nr:DMT family transporter [Motilibacter deserti]NHC16170.1 DMT family transporter [Motilibacter deserti]